MGKITRSFQLLLFLIIALVYSVSCSSDSTSANEEIEYGSVVDVDNNNYKTVVIGNQEWMAENLKTSRFQDGTDILHEPNKEVFGRLETGAWIRYENNAGSVNSYGKLYNWFAVDDERGLCPSGWKVPNESDWNELEHYLGENAGGKLKEINGQYWESPNTGATNSTGFSARPGGFLIGSSFYNEGHAGYWWSSTVTESDREQVHVRRLVYRESTISKEIFYITFAMSVRCIKS